MHGDNPDGSFSLDELAHLEAAGVIEIQQPGTPEAAAFDQAIADELASYDAELLKREGPDALTSGRYLRQTALGAERDPERVGYALAAFCRARGWERSDLADWLGITIDQLAALALERRADPGYPLDSGPSRVDLSE